MKPVEREALRTWRAGLKRLLRDGALRTRLVRNAPKTAEQFHVSKVATHLREVVQKRVPTAG